MPDLGSIVGVIFPLLTLLAVGACALLYGVTTTLRANNGDLKDRVGILEHEGETKDHKITALQAEVIGQKGELDALRKVVTGEIHLVAITDLLTAHHTQAVKEWRDIETVLIRIDTTMAGTLAILRADADPKP